MNEVEHMRAQLMELCEDIALVVQTMDARATIGYSISAELRRLQKLSTDACWLDEKNQDDGETSVILVSP